MASLVRLGPGKSGGPLGITSHGIEHTILTPSMRAIRFKAGTITRIGGKHDGEQVEDGVVEANQTVLIELPTPLSPRRYELMVSYNPELLRHGTVSCPPILEPGKNDIFVQIRCVKKTDLTEFDYIFELRLID